MLAASKHFKLIDFNPSAVLNSSTFSSEASQLYNEAMSLRLLCISRGSKDVTSYESALLGALEEQVNNYRAQRQRATCPPALN